MKTYSVIIETDDSIFQWSFRADNAMHALEQYMDDPILDSSIGAVHIEVREDS